MKIRKSLSISDAMLTAGNEIVTARRFDDFSEMVSALIREEFERRKLALDAPQQNQSVDRAALLKTWESPSASLNDKLAANIKTVEKPANYKKPKK